MSSPFESHALETLRIQGLRITEPRRWVIRSLASTQSALTPADIFAWVAQQGASVDLVSVYRIIEKFCEIGIVHRIAANDGYAACQADHEHGGLVEHLVCGQCGKVSELTLSEASSQAVSSQAALAGFNAQSIRIEVLGECSDCTSHSADR